MRLSFLVWGWWLILDGVLVSTLTSESGSRAHRCMFIGVLLDVQFWAVMSSSPSFLEHLLLSSRGGQGIAVVRPVQESELILKSSVASRLHVKGIPRADYCPSCDS